MVPIRNRENEINAAKFEGKGMHEAGRKTAVIPRHPQMDNVQHEVFWPHVNEENKLKPVLTVLVLYYARTKTNINLNRSENR